MKKLNYIFLSAAALALATPAHAEVIQRIETSTTGENSSVNIDSSVNANSQTTYSSISDNSVSIHQSGGDNNQVIINNNTFKIVGTITTSSADSISVSGQKISIDKSKVSNFSQTGNLNIGNKVTVEGKVISGTLYAEKIAAGDGGTSSTPKPSSSSSNQISININSSSIPNLTSSISATLPDSAVLGTQTNAIQQIINALQGVINQLKSIFKL